MIAQTLVFCSLFISWVLHTIKLYNVYHYHEYVDYLIKVTAYFNEIEGRIPAWLQFILCMFLTLLLGILHLPLLIIMIFVLAWLLRIRYRDETLAVNELEWKKYHFIIWALETFGIVLMLMNLIGGYLNGNG